MDAEEQQSGSAENQREPRARKGDREWLSGMLTALSVARAQEEWERIFVEQVRADRRPRLRVVKQGPEA